MYGAIWVMTQGPQAWDPNIYVMLQFNSMVQSWLF